MAFKLCSALSQIITWDDVFNTLDTATVKTVDFRWLKIAPDLVVRCELSNPLTKEGIVGFMFLVHGLDYFAEAELQKGIDDIKIRRLNFVKAPDKPKLTFTPTVHAFKPQLKESIPFNKELVDLSRSSRREEARYEAAKKFQDEHTFKPKTKSIDKSRNSSGAPLSLSILTDAVLMSCR